MDKNKDVTAMQELVGEVNAGCTIIAQHFNPAVPYEAIVLAYKKTERGAEYVDWLAVWDDSYKMPSYYYGHYFGSFESASKHFNERK
jgi:hypothetical protein